MSDNLERTLGRILATQEHILKTIEEYSERLEGHMKEDRELDKRISTLEHSKTYLLGIVGTIAFIVPYISDLLLTRIGLK